ncbi:hypothetical protein PO909_008552, partial [Leuciscus waleckii]
VDPTSYCHLNRAVPILRLYFNEAADHRSHLCLSLPSIMSLIAAVRLGSDHGWERDIEVLVFLYWLAHAASYRMVSRTFDIPKSSVHDIVHRVSKAIMGILRRVICFPTGDDVEAVGAGFAQLSGSPAFSRTVVAIDGCHIRIKPPANNSHCFFNRNLFHSITDHRGKFLDVFVGYPGSVRDARVLRNSRVYAGSVYPPAGKCILGDGGYPCLSAPICLITPSYTPYREPVQNSFQQQALPCPQHAQAFGMQKTRWHCIFFKALEVNPAFLPEVVACCAVLHNLALLIGDIVEPEDEEDHDDGPSNPHNLAARVVEHVRDNLAAVCSKHSCACSP